MSLDPADLRCTIPVHPQIVRRLFWLGLLGTEVLGLNLRYDTVSVNSERTWGVGVLQHVPIVPRIALAVLTILAITGAIRLGPRSHDDPRSARWSLRSWCFLVGHLAVFAVFYRLTGLIFEGNTRSLAYPAAWTFAWAASGLACLLLWTAVELPPELWPRVARSGGAMALWAMPLGLAAWSAGWLSSRLWLPLGHSTFWASQALLSLFCRETICRLDEAVLGTSRFQVSIAPQCAGFQGIGLILILLGVYLWWFRARLCFPRAWLLLPLGVLAIWLANVVRIVALILIGDQISPAIAVGGFHSVAGWLAFNAIGLGLIGLAHEWRWLSKAASDAALAPGGDSPRAVDLPAAYLVPFLVVIATTMVTTAASAGFDWLYPLRVLTAGAALWGFRRAYREIRWSWSWPAVGIGVVVFALWIALEPRSGGTDAGLAMRAGLGRLPTAWTWVWVVTRVVGSVVTVPLAEELAFRGYLARRLIAVEFSSVPLGQFTWWSLLVSSALFGALHSQFLAGTLAGIAYYLAACRKGRLFDAVLAHATTNALIAAFVLTTQHWSLWAG